MTLEQLQGRVDLTSCSKKNKLHTFEFKKMADSLAVKRENSEEDQKRHQDSVPGHSLSSKLETSKVSDNDAELDLLLKQHLTLSATSLEQSSTSTNSPTKRSVSEVSTVPGMISSSRMEDVSSDTTLTDIGIRQTEVKQGSGITSSQTVVRQFDSECTVKSDMGDHVNDTDTLDDMLDELLS